MRHALIGSWQMRSSKCMRYFRMLIPAAYPKASPIGFGGGKRTVASGSLWPSSVSLLAVTTTIGGWRYMGAAVVRVN